MNEAKIDKLGDILGDYVHLRYINLAHNNFKDIEILTKIPYILELDLSHNSIDSMAAFNEKKTLEYLAKLNLSNNQITDFSEISLKRIQNLDLSNNQIATCSFKGSKSLLQLELRSNQLTNFKGISNMPRL